MLSTTTDYVFMNISGYINSFSIMNIKMLAIDFLKNQFIACP